MSLLDPVFLEKGRVFCDDEGGDACRLLDFTDGTSSCPVVLC